MIFALQKTIPNFQFNAMKHKNNFTRIQVMFCNTRTLLVPMRKEINYIFQIWYLNRHISIIVIHEPPKNRSFDMDSPKCEIDWLQNTVCLYIIEMSLWKSRRKCWIDARKNNGRVWKASKLFDQCMKKWTALSYH